jgi:hypothetical protein
MGRKRVRNTRGDLPDLFCRKAELEPSRGGAKGGQKSAEGIVTERRRPERKGEASRQRDS